MHYDSTLAVAQTKPLIEPSSCLSLKEVRMPQFIHVESVNMGGVIFDTEDLSTRRAGGYMLLDLVHEVRKAGQDLAGNDKLFKAVSLGASIGLFELLPEVEMKDAIEAINAVLKRDLFAQATVIVVNTQDKHIVATSFPDICGKCNCCRWSPRSVHRSSVSRGLRKTFAKSTRCVPLWQK
jgi:hypothetical protein